MFCIVDISITAGALSDESAYTYLAAYASTKASYRNFLWNSEFSDG